MSDPGIRRDNHYVPCGYLKHWVSDTKVWAYRTLVSHHAVREWKASSPRGIAYHQHLYTRLAGGSESDEFERWLATEYEYPASDPLAKAVSGARMSRTDWDALVHFVAAQDLRTPARFLEEMQRWQRTLPELIETSLRSSVERLEQAVRNGDPLPQDVPAPPAGSPFKIVKHVRPDEPTGQVEARVLVGRALWLWSMRHALQHTAKVLLGHRWTIVRPPDGLTWFTSDTPVLRLNYSSPSQYDFRGGWGSSGTEIIMPLDPEHLLYTQVGSRPPWTRSEEMPFEKARLVRRVIAERAHRFIYAAAPDSEVSQLRPRVVDAAAFERERDQWSDFHRQQTEAERRFENEAPPATENQGSE